MCSINGAFVIKSGGNIDPFHLRNIILSAQERGRDSCGIWANNEFYFSTERNVIPKIPLDLGNIVINNNRAEPTTEYVKNKTEQDVQPFISKNFVVAHNGTIANDRELEEKYKLERRTKIDSAIIPLLLEKFYPLNIFKLKDILVNQIIGSYALAIWDKYNKTLILATNYKPLFLEYKNKVIYFSSLETYLSSQVNPNSLFEKSKIYQISPYSLITLAKNSAISYDSLWKPEPEKDKRVLVICSGGLDSVITATKLKRDGFDVTLLHFVYGCRAEKKEIEAVKKISDYLNLSYLIVPLDIFKSVIGHSRLTNTKEELITERQGEASAELAWEWVPARNLIMYSIAVGIAESRGITYIALGNNLEESGAYPDNEMIFANKLNEVLPFATNLQNRVRIVQPVGNLMKHEIVKLGLELKAPLHLTWSCYEGRDKHCGTCGPCYMRKKAFQMNNQEEVIQYEN